MTYARSLFERWLGPILAGLWLWPAAVHAYECPPLELAPERQTTDVRHPRGLLWEVSRSGSDPSYVFGTIHVSDPQVLELPEAVTRALHAADNFVMEALLDGPDALDFYQEMFYQDGTRLADQLDSALYDRALQILAGHGIPPESAQNMKPWAAYLTMNMPPAAGIPLDLVLMSMARGDGKTVYGLETLAEQAGIFAAIDPEAQLQLLIDAICHYETIQKDMETMKILYLERDLSGLYRFKEKYRMHDSPRYRRLLRSLLTDRNRLMVERMLPRLEEGSAFVAVGAMHLPGSDGVLALLEQHGYTVRPLY